MRSGPVGGRAPVVAIAEDEAFWFYYPANLALLEDLGARLVRFSPLAGEAIPDEATHLYWGGGFPEEYVETLAAQRAALSSYRQRIVAGLHTWAECGGYMALGDAILDRSGNTWPMVGLIPMVTVMERRLQGFGYRDIELAATHAPLPPGTAFRGHEFHYSRLQASPPSPPLYRLTGTRGHGDDGVFTETLMAGYAHLYFPSNPQAIQAWLYPGRFQ